MISVKHGKGFVILGTRQEELIVEGLKSLPAHNPVVQGEIKRLLDIIEKGKIA